MLLKKLFKKKKMFNSVKITTLGLTFVLTTLALRCDLCPLDEEKHV
jgi:hypothetical protein